MRDLIALLLFAISGYFIFHNRADDQIEPTSFQLVPLPDAPDSPRKADRPDDLIEI